MGLACIIIPHIMFYCVMGDNFGGLIPNWLLWFTAALHMLYMVNIRKYFRISIIWMESKPDGQVKLYLQF